MYRKTLLANGLTLVTHSMAQMESVAVGIWVRDKCLVKNNTAVNNGQEGIFVRESGTGCRIEANLVTGNNTGIRIEDHAGCFGHIVLKNTANSNTTNYNMGTNNTYGPIINVAGVGDISGTDKADHPWVNFEF